jgi:hypothetical protein
MKERLLVLFIASLFLNGCAKFSVIDSTKQLENPKVVNVEFVPIKAEGKETITKGTEKVVDKTGFKIDRVKVNGMDGISISKSDVKVTVAQATFNFLKNQYGMKEAVVHPLAGENYKMMHVWGPWDAPAFKAWYKADSKGIYQVYDMVPFNKCIIETYKNDANKELLNDFQQAFAEGKILPFLGNDKRTPQEIKAQMEGLIGQPYCSEYYKSNIVYYVKIENLGSEKIRLWPVEESVIVDNNNSQYKSASKDGLDLLLKPWYERLSKLPKGKDNPVVGVYLSKKVSDNSRSAGYTQYEDGMMVFGVERNLPADVAGIADGDTILEVNGKSIDDMGDFQKALSNKIPGDVVKVRVLKKGNSKDVREIDVKLMSADQWTKPSNIRVLAGGNVYPNVIYDGYLVFDTLAMLNNYKTGSEVKLIIPLIGTSFDASDKPIHSFDFEFDFKLEKM